MYTPTSLKLTLPRQRRTSDLKDGEYPVTKLREQFQRRCDKTGQNHGKYTSFSKMIIRYKPKTILMHTNF